MKKTSSVLVITIFSFFSPVPFLYVLWFINGIAQSLIWGPILRIVSPHAILNVLTYSGASVGSLIFGVVVKNFGYSPMFLSWFVLALISGVAMLYKSKS